MRQFAILINNEVQGPHSEAEIKQMIADGRVTADTLCAIAGSGEWEPLSLHFAFGSKLKISSQPFATSEAEADAQANRLHPEVRRKLLMYTLADSVTVDQFTQTQAEIAIAAHERRIMGKIRRRQVIGWTFFLGALAGMTTLGLQSGGVADTLSDMAAGIVKDDDKSPEKFRILNGEIRRYEMLRKSAETAIFAKPPGAMNPVTTLMTRLKVNDSKAYRLRGSVDITPLADQVARWKIEMSSEDLRVYVLPDIMPTEVARKVTSQSSVLDTVLSPLLDDAGFEVLRAKVAGSFPDDPTQPESARLKVEVDKLKLNDLKSIIERVEFRARAAERDPRGKQWATALRDYAARLRDLQGRARISADPAARRELWNEFSTTTGAELAAWVISSNAKEIKVGNLGVFSVEETAKFDLNLAGQRILVTCRIGGDTLYLPWGSKYLTCRDLQSEALPRELFLHREQYKVTAKTVTGGRRHVAKGRVNGRELSVERKSPRWHFLTLSREKDTDSLVFLVDEKSFEHYAVGAVIPVSVLLKFELYPRPGESVAPSPLTPVE